MVKHLPVNTNVQLDPGWERALEEEMENHSNILDGIIPWTESLAGYILWGCKELDRTEHTSIFLI